MCRRIQPSGRKRRLAASSIERTFEGFPFHDVAPVTGRVADGKEDRPVAFSCQDEGPLIPGLPVDRIVRVLEQVGTLFLGETVGEGNLGEIRGIVGEFRHAGSRKMVFLSLATGRALARGREEGGRQKNAP